jgi:hypothetical protein
VSIARYALGIVRKGHTWNTAMLGALQAPLENPLRRQNVDMNPIPTMEPLGTQVLLDVARALAEDVGSGDLTAAWCPQRAAPAPASGARSRRDLRRPLGRSRAARARPPVQLTWHVAEGQRCAPDQVVLEIEGDARALLSAERTALNFLQLLSRRGHQNGHLRGRRGKAPARTSWTRARPCPACAWRKSTPCAWAAAPTTASACTTPCSSKKTTLPLPVASRPCCAPRSRWRRRPVHRDRSRNAGAAARGAGRGRQDGAAGQHAPAHAARGRAHQRGRAILEISGGVTLDGLRALQKPAWTASPLAPDQGRQGHRLFHAPAGAVACAPEHHLTLKDVEIRAARRRRRCLLHQTRLGARAARAQSQDERAALKDKIRRLLKEKNAVMVSHYYVHPDLQDLAEETGGIVSDSLEMARFGRDHAAQTWW